MKKQIDMPKPDFDEDGKAIMLPGEHRFSASQISTFELCPRLWAFQKIDGLRTKDHPATSFGSAMHEILEDYLRDGTKPDPEKIYSDFVLKGKRYVFDGRDMMSIIAPGLKYWPKPGGSCIEGEIWMRVPDVGWIMGFIDVQPLDSNQIGDHKSSGNLRWVKTKTQLLDDGQATIYCKWKMDSTGAKTVPARWVYYLRDKKKPTAYCVDVLFTKSRLDKNWQALVQTMKKMQVLKNTVTEARKVTCDDTGCGAFSGCDFKDICTRKQFKEEDSTSMSTLRERMEAAKAAKAAKTAPAPAAKKKATKKTEQAVNPPEEDLVIEAEVVETPAPKAPKAAKPRKSRAKATPKGVVVQGTTGSTLYVNCVPMNVDVTPFTEIVAAVNLKCQEDNGVPHYRLIPDLYGGNGAVFQEALKEHGLPNAMTINTNCTEAADAMSLLYAHYDVVVVGI